MMEKVSVIIPTWNRATTLLNTVLSALHQTYPVFEILICDDGSTDNSKEIIEKIGDNRIHWIDCGRNGRPAVPRNKGIEKSTGDWIAFLDSDDEWLPEKIELQLKKANETGCEAVSCNAFRYLSATENGGAYLDIDLQTISFDDLMKCNFIICSSSMVKRTVLLETALFSEGEEFKAIEDYALWIKIATRTPFAYLKQPLVKYLDTPGQSIRSVYVSEKDQRKVIFNEFLSWAKKDLIVRQKQLRKAEKMYAKTFDSTLQLYSYKVKKMFNGND